MSNPSAAEQPAGPAEASLRVYLLGPPEVRWAGHPLLIPRRQTRALLYCLATRLEPVPRERLCFLFWPDTPEPTARRNLSHLLTHLRRALPAREVLLTADDHVALDPQRAWSDAAAFERLCTNLTPLPPTPSPLSTPSPDSLPRHGGGSRERGRGAAFGPGGEDEGKTLHQAVALYRGPFLSGFSLPASSEFDAWAAQERRVMERLYLEALATLIETEAVRGDRGAAIAYAQRYLETDDLAEEIHRRLIQLYAASGDRGAALRQFERCAAILERELGVRPLPETRAVYQAILKGTPLSDAKGRPPPLQPPVTRLTWATLPGLDVPLVGRERALRCLEQAYARAQGGHGRMVLISGEAGIGKSRLMQDFATRLQDRALILTGASHPGAQTLPYHPIVQALRNAFNVQRSTLNVQRIWLAEASRLLPELRDTYPDLPSPLPAEPDEARTRLFEALCRVVLALTAAGQPLLLCLDDLHWADGATLDWLGYLGRQLRDNRLLILGSYRSEEADAVAPLRHSLARPRVLSELQLTGLDTTAVLQLLHHLVGSVPGDRALAHRLQRATGGNPFFLLETLRVLLESGQPLAKLAVLQDLPLPDTVREALAARLKRLSPQARQVLEAGAILGTTFDFDPVRLTAGRGEMETVDGLDELVARQLLVQQETGYRFHHDLTRRAVEASLSPVRHQLLHRRAGRALEQLQPDAVATLAHHFDAGGEPKKALHYHDLAAQRAEALFAWREAEEHQTRMLELLDQLDPERSDPDCLAQRGRVLADRAHLRFLQGRLAERGADLNALVELAEASDEARLRLEATAHRVRYLNLDGRYEEAIALARGSLPLAERLDDVSARSRLLAQIGFAHYFLGQPQQALTVLEAALEAVGDEADPQARGRIVHILGYVHLHLGHYAQALACQREAYACHQTVGDHNRMAWDLTDMGILCTRLNRLAEAEQHLTEALALARKIGSQPAESYALNNLGTLHYVRGDYTTALRYHRESLALQRATGSRRGEASALMNSGIVYLALGDPTTAESLLRQAIAIQEEIRYGSGLAEGLAHLARAQAALERPAEALTTAQRALKVARRIGDPYAQVTALNVLAQLHLAAGSPAEVLPLAREAVARAEEVGLVHGRVFGWINLGLAHLALGNPQEAHRHTRQAVALLEDVGCVEGPEEAVYLAHARVLQALGRVEEAEKHIRRAERTIEIKAASIDDADLRRQYLRSTARL